MTESERTPGYSYRRAGAKHMMDQGYDDVEKFNKEEDGDRGIPVRTAKPEDAERIGTRRSPLM